MFSVTVNGSSLGELESNLRNLLSQFGVEQIKIDHSELDYVGKVGSSFVEATEDDTTYEEPVKVAPVVAEQIIDLPVGFTIAPPVIPQQTVTSATVDSKGMPYDQRIHSASKATTRDGAWRYRRGIEEETIAKVEAELRGEAPPAPIAAPVEAPAFQPQPNIVVPVAPPPPPMDIKPAHTFETFKAQMIQTIADLVDAKKINAEYLQLLKNHFKVAEIWDLRKDDSKCLELFQGFVDNGLITKVG